MSIVGVVIVLCVIGFLLWLVTSQIPMDATIKKIITVVVIVVVCIWLLQVFGLIGSLNQVRVR